MTRVLIEASGGLTSGYIIANLKSCDVTIIGSDINSDNHGSHLCDEFVEMPSAKTPNIRHFLEQCIKDNSIELVIPSLDETLFDWAKIAEQTGQMCSISISPSTTIEVFQDKWNSFQFFKESGVKTPNTSLTLEYDFFKPRNGRGSTGIFQNNELSEMPDNYITQEFIEGVEYTIDCLFSRNGDLIYCVPRKRLKVVAGKSLSGVTVNNTEIIKQIAFMSRLIKFEGMINFQCIENGDGIFFLEVNPRLAGGMALGIAATENWFQLLISDLIQKKTIKSSVKPKYPLTMHRYYNEIFT